jgi:hypothetical protein
MIFKCSSCQFETPAALPPLPQRPEKCAKCGNPALVAIHDTLPPPGVEPDDATPPDVMVEDDASPDGLGDSDSAKRRAEKPKLLISTMLYALSRELGAEAATKELHRQVEELSGPFSGERNPEDFLPVAYLIARAMRVFDVGLYVDAGATVIGKARSRAMAHAMKHSEFEVWLSADDDVECTLPTIVALYDACTGGAPAVAIGPCFVRGRPLVNVALPQVVVERTLVGSQAKLRTALFGGFGLVAMSQQALTRIAAESPWFVDDDGERKPAAFADVLAGGQEAGAVSWFGEDLSFFLRVPKSVRVEALTTGHIRHAGETLTLARLEEYERMQAPATWLAARGFSESTERVVLKQPEVESVVDGPA